jgi:hypothetical protein
MGRIQDRAPDLRRLPGDARSPQPVHASPLPVSLLVSRRPPVRQQPLILTQRKRIRQVT